MMIGRVKIAVNPIRRFLVANMNGSIDVTEKLSLIERLDAMRREWEIMLLLPRPQTKAQMREEYWRVHKMRMRFENDPDVAAILSSKGRFKR